MKGCPCSVPTPLAHRAQLPPARKGSSGCSPHCRGGVQQWGNLAERCNKVELKCILLSSAMRAEYYFMFETFLCYITTLQKGNVMKKSCFSFEEKNKEREKVYQCMGREVCEEYNTYCSVRSLQHDSYTEMDTKAARECKPKVILTDIPRLECLVDCIVKAIALRFLAEGLATVSQSMLAMESEWFLLLVTGFEVCLPGAAPSLCHGQLGVTVSSRDFHGTNAVSHAAAEAL
ncbi:hypothetical protein EK904_003484 [Melospiza melodia maxima]|nr:hypothetical protein EK904_003484 [Melospiza melodia maxima]